MSFLIVILKQQLTFGFAERFLYREEVAVGALPQNLPDETPTMDDRDFDIQVQSVVVKTLVGAFFAVGLLKLLFHASG